MDYLYKYPPLLSGKLIKRYKRFFADVELETGEIVTAHCPNTGPMKEVYLPGNRVQISPSNNPKRKLAYTWEMIQINDSWVGVNTGLPNKVIKIALEQKIFSELAPDYSRVRSEVPYGKDKKSRIDFLLTGENHQLPIYLEVKNVTLTQGKMALFPDTVTTRGQKHLQELMALTPHAKGVMLYFINRGDCISFAPGDNFDPEYGILLREAVAAGLQVLPCSFEVTPTGIKYLGLVDFIPSSLSSD